MPEERTRCYLLVPVAEEQLCAVWLRDAEIATITAGRRTTSPSTAVAAQASDRASLAAAEADLDEADGLRPILQARARAELAAAGVPLTRAAVLRRAHVLLGEHRTQRLVATSADDNRRLADRGEAR